MSTNRCHDCGALPGALHDFGCDMEPCPICGMQLIGCGHGRPAEGTRIPWDGEGVLRRAARRYDFWCVPDERCGWIPCLSDKPGATLDLNRVERDCQWDATTRAWVDR